LKISGVSARIVTAVVTSPGTKFKECSLHLNY